METHSLFNHSPFACHLGCFQFGVVRNKVAINILVQVLCEYKSPFLWNECPRMQFLGHKVITCFSSVQFSHSVMSNSFRPHGLQHARPPCPSPTPRVYPNSCPLSRWCHPAISSSVIPFSSCLQSFLESGFLTSQLFASSGQSGSFSFNISPFNEHSGLISFRMNWLDLLAVQGTFKSLLQHHSSKASILPCSAFFTVQLSHPYTTTGKTIVFTRWAFVGKVMSLLLNMLSRLVITFLPRSWHLLIS